MSIESINDFRKNFYNIYNSEVVPAVKEMEKERQNIKEKIEGINKIIYIAIAVIIVISILFAVFIAGIFKFNIFITIFVLVLGVNVLPIKIAVMIAGTFRLIKKKTFEAALKSRVMPLLMKAFGDFEWRNSSVMDINTIHSSRLLDGYKDIPPTTDDNFIGTYKNVLIKISEQLFPDIDMVKKSKSLKNIFFGVFIELECLKKFSGHTVIQPIKNKKPNYPEIKLEDIEFSKKFSVNSTEQVEARYLLTPAFMQRYKNIQNAFGADAISCSFLNNKVLFAIPIEKDLFSLGSLDKPVTDATQFNIFLNEIISILEIIEELKLYEDTGL